MFIQATISCKCGCVSRIEFQDGKHSYTCPQCKATMNPEAYEKLERIMGEFGDWNTDMLKNAQEEPKMRAITLSIADLVD